MSWVLVVLIILDNNVKIEREYPMQSEGFCMASVKNSRIGEDMKNVVLFCANKEK